jgi:hypothetical protein
VVAECHLLLAAAAATAAASLRQQQRLHDALKCPAVRLGRSRSKGGQPLGSQLAQVAAGGVQQQAVHHRLCGCSLCRRDDLHSCAAVPSQLLEQQQGLGEQLSHEATIHRRC